MQFSTDFLQNCGIVLVMKITQLIARKQWKSS